MNCSHCQHEFTAVRSATVGKDVALPGDMFLCPRCGLVSIAYMAGLVGEGMLTSATLKLRPIREDEFDAMTDEEKLDLNFALRAMVSYAKRQGAVSTVTTQDFIQRWNEVTRMKNIRVDAPEGPGKSNIIELPKSDNGN